MGKKYINRINQLIQRTVTRLLLEQSNDPRLAEVTITDASVNRDTTRAEIYYSIIGTQDDIKEVQTVLDGAAGWVRSKMMPVLRLRNIPQLVFVYDPSLAHGARIDEILHQLHDKDAQTDDPNEDTLQDSDTDSLATT